MSNHSVVEVLNEILAVLMAVLKEMEAKKK